MFAHKPVYILVSCGTAFFIEVCLYSVDRLDMHSLLARKKLYVLATLPLSSTLSI